ncbi:MAG: LexA family transcriptional regulator [Clostridia bacterium]|nr:LexA family transcriptional regulator [Clostridia bacterium]
MIGEMIAYIRKERNLTKASIARGTNINTGHLTHIEKGERNPSHKVLKNMCKTMGIPYRPLMYTYDKELTEEHHSYKVETHIPYNKIPSFDSLGTLMDCPASVPGASIAVKVTDTAMEPKLKKDSYVYIEFNTPLDNRDLGLFSYQNQLLIRRFIVRKDGVVLRAEDKEIADICLNPKEDFYIIGKIVGTNLDDK